MSALSALCRAALLRGGAASQVEAVAMSMWRGLRSRSGDALRREVRQGLLRSVQAAELAGCSPRTIRGLSADRLRELGLRRVGYGRQVRYIEVDNG